MGCLLLLAGCPEFLSSFDMTGSYAGKWVLPGEGDAADEKCPITLDLVHYALAEDPVDATEVEGYVNLDFTCFETLQTLLNLQEIEVGEIRVVGRIVVGGNFLLRSEDIIGGCNSDLCISLVLTGQAKDIDDDGQADTLAGEWTAVFPVQLSGTFSATLVEEDE
ncbi:MAG: hypothetical protein JNK74_13660 [Candidatus Hydrogenedentes bacterium]|nr:hypothetical protein [Candidatus Hydrogenedentota bacterium]